MNVMKKIREIIFNHYVDTHYHRSEKQLEREKWLIPKVIPFNRYMLMPAAVLIQVSLLSSELRNAKI